MRPVALRRLIGSGALVAGLVAGAGACTPTSVPGCLLKADAPSINHAAHTATIGGRFATSTGAGVCTAGLNPGDHDELDIKLFQTNDPSTGAGIEVGNYISTDMWPTSAAVPWNADYSYSQTIVSATLVSGAKRTPVATAYSTVVAHV